MLKRNKTKVKRKNLTEKCTASSFSLPSSRVCAQKGKKANIQREAALEPLHPRHTDILDIARQRGRVDVEGLAASFDVTPQTIRKDLNDLCDRHLLQRVHGGAVYPSGVANFAYDSRRILAADSKQLIGAAAAKLIPDNSSIILNIGTTTEQVALALRRHQGIMAITNNINVANILRDAPSAEVVIAGGVVRHSDGGIMGEATVDFVKQFKVDFAVIGASAIDKDGSILDFDFREVKVSQAIIEHARQTILVADSLKFERTAPVRIAELSMVDIFVTDAPPPEGIAAICARHDVQLIIAEDMAKADAA
jgi:DeoR family transcriptional regulator, glycerol-3-phosphate regulon repressor